MTKIKLISSVLVVMTVVAIGYGVYKAITNHMEEYRYLIEKTARYEKSLNDLFEKFKETEKDKEDLREENKKLNEIVLDRDKNIKELNKEKEKALSEIEKLVQENQTFKEFLETPIEASLLKFLKDQGF